MAQSFGLVEDKLHEAQFFLEQLNSSSRLSFEAQCYFSAFVSAARSVTLALQASMSGVPGFEEWYQGARAKLKSDPLAPFFKEIRNDVVHKGLNPLDRVTFDHLREDLLDQMQHKARSHVLVLPDLQAKDSTVLADAVEASTLYFASLVQVIFDCYDRFKCTVDPQWYFTEINFSANGKTFEDAIAELGFPPVWASCAPAGDGRWRALRSLQPACLINDLFQKYLYCGIVGPDDAEGNNSARAEAFALREVAGKAFQFAC